MSTPDHEHWYSHRRYLYLLAQLLLVGIVLFITWRFLGVVGAVFKPVLLSLIVAYLLDPLIDVFERRGINRSLAILLVATVVLILVGGLLLLVLPTFIEQFRTTMTRLPAWFEANYASWTEFAAEKLGYSPSELDDSVKSALHSVQEAALRGLSNAGGSAHAVLNALLIPIFVFYFLRDFDVLKHKPLVFVPPRYRDYVVSRARTMDEVVGGWVRGQVEVSLVLALLYAIGLAVVGVRLGFVIGIVAGLLNIVPYFGAGIGIALSVLMILVEHGGWVGLVKVGVVFAVIHLFESYLITPKLVGKKVGMSPVTVIIVLLVGGSVLGLFGLLLAVPLTAATLVLVQDLLVWYRGTSWYSGDES